MNHITAQRERDLDAARDRMAAQRRQRQERDAAAAVSLAKRVAEHRARAEAQGRPTEGWAGAFWDCVDTSGGADACHPWTGAKKWNHPETREVRYEEPVFQHRELIIDTRIATRVLMFAVYGKEVPADMDVRPLCENHLCCNMRHMAITPHGGSNAERRMALAVPAEEFFCAGV